MSSNPFPAVPGATSSVSPLTRLEVILSVVSLLSGPDGRQFDQESSDNQHEILAKCHEAFPNLSDRISEGDVRVALVLTTRAKGLFGPRQASFWGRVATGLSKQAVWAPRTLRYGVIAAGSVVILLGVLSVWHGKQLSRWISDVEPISTEATKLSQDASLLSMTASSVSASPAGAYAHSQAALSDLSAASESLTRLYVSNSDANALGPVFRQHPDPTEVIAHDKPLLAAMAYRLHHAHSELDLAHEIQSTAQKWSSLSLPASLSSDLGSYWLADAATLTTALQSGDIAAVENADQHLDALVSGSQDQTAVKSWLDGLSSSDRAAANKQLSPLASLIAANDRAGIKAIVAQWTAMKTDLPLTYQLMIGDGHGKHGVERALVGSKVAPRDYLLVHAVDPSGNPVTVSVFDTESQMLISAQQFGIEVPSDVYGVVRDQVANTTSNVSLGFKSAGSAVPTYSVAVLPGRITHW